MAESQNIEYKESWRDEYLKWICGFANARGGCIYIGVRDDGKIVGIPDSKKLLEDIPNPDKPEKFFAIPPNFKYNKEKCWRMCSCCLRINTLTKFMARSLVMTA